MSSRTLPPVCQDKVHVVHHHLYATRAQIYCLVLLWAAYRGEMKSFAGTRTCEIAKNGFLPQAFASYSLSLSLYIYIYIYTYPSAMSSLAAVS